MTHTKARNVSYLVPIGGDKKLFKALHHQLVEWHFGPMPFWSGGYIYIPLNKKLDAYIFLDSDQIKVAVRNDGYYEVIWEVELGNPQSLERLKDFLRELPNELARVDPSKYAIDPLS